MEKVRRYELEGLSIDIPVYYDKQADIYIENYPDFIENPIWTPQGHRVLFSGMDACKMAEGPAFGECVDCGSCCYFKRAAEHTWFGVCTNDNNPLNKITKNKKQ